MATLQIAQDNKIPVLTATATNPKVTVDNGKVRPYVFRACFIDPFQGKVMADFATKTVKAKTAAIYVDNSSIIPKAWPMFLRHPLRRPADRLLLKRDSCRRIQTLKQP